MTDLIPAEEIEQIVGAPRHATIHFGRAVSMDRKVYILHSARCLRDHPDLRTCPYSKALDLGIDTWRWTEDQLTVLRIESGRLVPAGWDWSKRR